MERLAEPHARKNREVETLTLWSLNPPFSRDHVHLHHCLHSPIQISLTGYEKLIPIGCRLDAVYGSEFCQQSWQSTRRGSHLLNLLGRLWRQLTGRIRSRQRALECVIRDSEACGWIVSCSNVVNNSYHKDQNSLILRPQAGTAIQHGQAH